MSELNRKADAPLADDLDRLVKLTIEDNPPPGKIFEVTFNQLRQEQTTEAPETLTGMLIEIDKSRRAVRAAHPGKRSLLLVAGLIVGLLSSIAILVLAVSSTTTPVPSVAASPTPAQVVTPPVDLPHAREYAYPGAKTLNFMVEDAPDIPHPPGMTVIFQSTNTDINTIADYYSKTLEAAGFTFSPESSCNLPNICHTRKSFHVAKGDIQITVWILTSEGWNHPIHGVLQYLDRVRKQMPLGENMIQVMVSSGKLSDVYFQSMMPPNNNAPLPTATVAQTVNPAQKVYFAPDGTFRARNGLVSKTVLPIATETPGMTFQLEWLVSDANETLLLGTLVDTSAQPKNRELSSRNVTVMTLTDEAGRVYELQQTEGAAISKFRQSPPGARVVGWRLKGKPLAPGTRKVILRATDKLTFELPKPLEINLQTFDEAKLPVATPYPQPLGEYKGIKMSVPYAYFGSDRTILQLKLDGAGYTGTMPFTNLEPSVTVLTATQILKTYDQNGKPLGLFDLTANERGAMQTQGISYLRNNQFIFEGKPIAPDVRSVRFELEAIANRQSSGGSTPTPASTLTVPVTDLLKGTAKPVTASLKPSGLPVEVLGVEVEVRDDPRGTAEKKIVISTIYQVKTDAASGLAATDVEVQCQNCGTNNMSVGRFNISSALEYFANPSQARSGPTKLSGKYPPDAWLYYFQIRYEPTQAEMLLALHAGNYQLVGKWAVTLPVTRQ
jgi:hypothetical protein